MATDRYNAAEAEARWQKIWDERGIFATPNPSARQRRSGGQAEILRAGDVPLSVGAHPYGPRPQLHDGRRGGAGEAGDGLCRAASDGLGRLRHAGRERGHRAQGPSQGLDLPEHRGDEGAIEVDGAVARLEPRDRDLRPGLLPAPAEDVPRFPARRPGRAAKIEGELGSGRSDGAGQRAGDRRPRLALRRAGRAARADAVVFQDHGVCPGAARRARYARPLAGKSPADAEELDRPLRGLAGALRARSGNRAEPRKRTGSLHHAAGHVVRREIHGDRAGSSARRGGGEEKSRTRRVHRRVPAPRHLAGRDRHRRENGLRHRHQGAAPVRCELEAAGLCRQFHSDGVRHRRHLRLPGARSARPRLRQQIRPRQHAGGLPARPGPEHLRHHRHRL